MPLFRAVTLGPRLALALVSAIAGFGIVAMNASDAEPSGAAAESTFVVFFGLDIRVEAGGATFPIVAATDRSVSIMRKGSRLNIPTDEAKFKTSLEPKLGQRQVRIEHLTDTRLFDAATDPDREALQQQLTMDAVQSDQQDMAAASATRAAAEAEVITRLAADPLSGVTQAQVQSANAGASNAAAAMSRAYTSPMFGSAQPGWVATDREANYDAFKVSFRVAAATAIEEAHGLLQLIIRSPDTNGQPVALLRFFPIHSISAEPRKVTVMQAGLPPGFTVDSYTLHVYAGEEELPTNLSPNRMDLNAAEAHQFLVLRHPQVNAHATIPAQIIGQLVPLAVRKWADQLSDDRAVNLAIDRQGRVTAVRLEAEPGSATEVAHMERWRQVPFLPALLNGVPVDSEGSFVPSELRR